VTEDNNMGLKFGKIASYLTLIAAWAYSLGWIKSLYYFSTFGVGLESLELTPQDYLFASWYTVENVMFFVLLLWVAALSGRLWPWLFVAAYLPIPFLTEWSYGHLHSFFWGYLADNPHSILKFLPFIVLILVILIHRDTVPRFKECSWTHGNFAFALLLIVALAWSISAAKHIGSSDAKRALRYPGANLQRVNLRFSDAAAELKWIGDRQKLYMLYFSPRRCILLDLADYNIELDQGKDQSVSYIRVIDVPRDNVRLVYGVRNIQMGAGELLWHRF
jgi:hypothetical protein